MATLLNKDDKLLQNGEQDPLGTGGGVALGSSGQGAFAGSSGGAGGATAPQVGSGGQAGQWTNIQSYLNANKGNTSSSKLVEGVGSKISDEKTKLNTEASTAKTNAETEADKTNIGEDQASKLIKDATASGRGTDPYAQATGTIKSAVKAEYGGPEGFTYGIGQDAQKIGEQIGDDQKFSGLMDNLHRESANKAGAVIGQGQLSLQRQLDLDPEAQAAIQDQRNRALETYAGLNSDYASLVPETDAAIKSAQKRFGTQKENLLGYLGGQETTNLGAIDSAVGDHNKYQTMADGEYQDWQGDVTSGVSRFNEQYGQMNPNAPGTITQDNLVDWGNSKTGEGDWTRADVYRQNILDAQTNTNADPALINLSKSFMNVYNQLTRDKPEYQAGQVADRQTVAGVDEQRNTYNTLLDILEKEGMLEDGVDAQKTVFKRPGLRNGPSMIGV